MFACFFIIPVCVPNAQKLCLATLKLEKNSGLNAIWTHDLCDTSTVLYQLSYQVIWELVTLWVHNISSIDGEEYLF